MNPFNIQPYPIPYALVRLPAETITLGHTGLFIGVKAICIYKSLCGWGPEGHHATRNVNVKAVHLYGGMYVPLGIAQPKGRVECKEISLNMSPHSENVPACD